MNKSEQDKMISASSVIGGLFKNCKREFVRVCPKCGEEIYHTYNNLEGVEKIDFYTQCSCKDAEYEQIAINAVKNNFEQLVKLNKQECGFNKRDIEEVKTVFKTHKGNIDAYNMLIEYGNKFDRNVSIGFYIHGPTGVGKSLMAKKVMTNVLNKGMSAYITNPPKLINDIRKETKDFKNDTIQKCVDVDLLVIDDFGTENGTGFQLEQLFLILESRWKSCKPIIFTSNLTLDEISSKYNDKGRIYSRICGTCNIVKMDGKDMRIESISL